MIRLLIALVLAATAWADLRVHVGTITQPAAVGVQTYTGVADGSGDFIPKVIIMSFVRSTSDGATFNAHPEYAWCSLSNGNVLSESVHSDGGTGTTNGRFASLAKCISYHAANGLLSAEATISATASGSFSLNWTNTDGVARIGRYLAVGGSDITNIATGAMNITIGSTTTLTADLGFRPSMVLLMGGPLVLDVWSTNADQFVNFTGTSPSTSSTSYTWQSTSGVNTSVAHSLQTSDAFLWESSSSTQLVAQGSIAINSTGFTLDFVTAGTGTLRLPYIAIKGGLWNAQFVTEPTSGTNQPITVTTGFHPAAAILFSGNQPANSAAVNHARMSFGLTDFSNNANTWFGAANGATGAGAQNGSTYTDATNVLSFLTEGHATPTRNGNITTATSNTSGMVLNVDATDGVARQIAVISVGSDAPVVPTVPRPRLIL